MKQSFCAIANRESGEDLIGTASHYQTYVLIECPTPWAAKAFESEQIPDALRRYVKAVKAKRAVQFLLVSKGRKTLRASNKASGIRLMVYEKFPPVDGTVEKYRGYEFEIDGLERVETCLEAHWQGDRLGKTITQKDVLICTHGMRDRCCARFGQPLFKNALRRAKQGRLPNVRLWKVSHIGGHRFAPTAITLPDGRYYGRLTLSALEAVINRSGSARQIQSIYRGWGMLPTPLQILERQLLIQYGWAWFDKVLTVRVLSSSGDELLVEVSVGSAAKQSSTEPFRPTTYRAKLVQDAHSQVCTKVSCGSAIAKPIVKYRVDECVQMAIAPVRAAVVEP
ncbi:sucrase ferredoxin [cf. Phormidesmis sp. LEGE 11477]|uniref:sucrase ferredoxin n=1 Tax=cf. Phormidesmis sp. LEGE 11477 TaxID=1828680 RepID=UPI00187EB222|nr:sucrase ferredoxin [cf. Phormidesmis sp. LEGE 11477]MBE9063515.1 sucrase ferredoxin [cf. Phormidesmis sp. LEGE 11477]